MSSAIAARCWALRIFGIIILISHCPVKRILKNVKLTISDCTFLPATGNRGAARIASNRPPFNVKPSVGSPVKLMKWTGWSLFVNYLPINREFSAWRRWICWSWDMSAGFKPGTRPFGGGGGGRPGWRGRAACWPSRPGRKMFGSGNLCSISSTF